MVKGISRRVIVVKAPVGSIFDEAIFIMRDDAVSAPDVNSEKILREACAAANEYVRVNCKQSRSFFRKSFIIYAVIAVVFILIAAFFIFLK